MSTEQQIGEVVEVTRKTWGTMTHIMYMERTAESEFVVKPKWEGSICYMLEDHQTFTDEVRARRWAETFV